MLTKSESAIYAAIAILHNIEHGDIPVSTGIKWVRSILLNGVKIDKT